VFRALKLGPRTLGLVSSAPGVADLHRRAEISRAANERYLTALAAGQRDYTFGGGSCLPRMSTCAVGWPPPPGT